MSETEDLNYLRLLEEAVGKVNWKKPSLPELERINHLVEKVKSEDFEDLDKILKLESILETIGDQWPLVPTAKIIAEKIHKYCQDLASDYIFYFKQDFVNELDADYIVGARAAYWITKSAALRLKYNLNDEQKQK